MKIKLKNSNLKLYNNDIQNKTALESLYIIGCPNITNTWSLLQSILQAQNNSNVLKRVRLDSINVSGTLYDLDNFVNSGLKGIKDNGEDSNYPALIGTWNLLGIYNNMETNDRITSLQNKIYSSGGDLRIISDKILISFTDQTVQNIIINNWGFMYDKDNNGNPLYGVSNSELEEVTTIANIFENTGIRTFNELEKFTGLVELRDNAFKGNVNLNSITLPPNLSRTGDSIFENTSLRSVIYPSSVTSIGNYQFGNNEDIDCVRIVGNINNIPITVGQNSFPGEYKIYVGDGSSPWHDNRVLSQMLSRSDWKNYYEDRLMTWYDKLCLDIIPEGYVKMDYIESDGINFVDTQEEFTNNTRFIADISFTRAPLNGNSIVYGSSDSGIIGNIDGGLKFIFKQGENSTSTFLFYQEYDNSWIGESSLENLYDIDLKNKLVKFNNNETRLSDNLSSNGGSITLFGNSEACFVGKSWMTEIYENDELIHNYIPVYRISDLTIGFYDEIEDNFIPCGVGGSNIDNRLVTEDNNRIIDVDQDFLQISEQSTNEIKVSLMRTQNINDCDNYFVPGSYGSNKEIKKYNLGTIKNLSNSLEYINSIQSFNNNTVYPRNSIVYYNENAYKFIKDHIGAWNYSDVVKTSAFREIENLKDLENNKSTLDINLSADYPIFIDDLETSGTQYIDLGLRIQPTYRIELKFKYDIQFTPGDYVFGDYRSSSRNSTYLKLPTSSDQSGSFSFFGTNSKIIPPNILTPDEFHTVILDNTGIQIDNNTISYTPTPGDSNPNFFLLFANNSYNSNVAGTNDEIYAKISTSHLILNYFKIYDKSMNRYIYDLKPSIWCNELCLTHNGSIYKNSGTGYFTTTTTPNISNQFENKKISIELLDRKLNENVVETYQYNTDSNGQCLIKVRKDSCYRIKLDSQITEFNDVYSYVNKNPYDCNNEKVFLILKKKSTVCNINISFNGLSDNNLLIGKDLYVFSSSSLESIVKRISNFTNDDNTISISVPMNQDIFIIPPSIDGYIDPNSQNISISESTLDVSFTYQQQ